MASKQRSDPRSGPCPRGTSLKSMRRPRKAWCMTRAQCRHLSSPRSSPRKCDISEKAIRASKFQKTRFATKNSQKHSGNTADSIPLGRVRCNHGRILGTGALLPRQLPQPQDLLPRTCQRATSLSREPLREHHASKKKRSQIVVLRSALCVRLRNCSLSRAGRRQLGSGGRISFRGCFCPSSNGDQVVHAWLLFECAFARSAKTRARQARAILQGNSCV